MNPSKPRIDAGTDPGLPDLDGPLARAWEATRPAPPTGAEWEAAWACIEARVQSPRRPGHHRHAAASAVLGLALAAAAAVLLAVLSPWDRGIGEGSGSSTIVEAGPVVRDLDLEEGQRVLYCLDRHYRVLDEEPGPFDGAIALLGHFEALDRGGPGGPTEWFIDVEPEQYLVYNLDHNTWSVVDEPEPATWEFVVHDSDSGEQAWTVVEASRPEAGYDPSMVDLLNIAECGFRAGSLALNAGPGPEGSQAH